MPISVILGQTVWGYPPKNWPLASCLSRSLELTRIDQQSTNILLVIHSNQRPMSPFPR